MAQAIRLTERIANELDRDLRKALRQMVAWEQEEALYSQRRVEDYRSWLVNKAAEFRVSVDSFCKDYDKLNELDDLWRRRVYTREETPIDQTERAVRNLYAMWIFQSQMFIERAEYFHRHKVNLDDAADRVRNLKRDAERLLRSWESPVPSSAPSFRVVELPDDVTDRIRELFPDVVS